MLLLPAGHFRHALQKVIELTDDFDVDVKDLAAVKAKLAEQGVTVSGCSGAG